jgi:hypothetical protein
MDQYVKLPHTIVSNINVIMAINLLLKINQYQGEQLTFM